MTVSPNRLATSPTNEADLRGAFRVESHGPQTVLYRPGEAGDRVFLLKAGRVRLLRVAPNEARAVTSILRAGDVFGDPFRLDSSVSDELAVTASECEIWSMDSREFRQQVETRPALAFEVFRAYAERVRGLQQRVVGLTFREVPARLAETLLELAQAHGEKCPHGGELDLRGVTQQDLADLVGASRSFVSTLVNEMKRDELLGNVGRTLCLRDTTRLKKLASKEK
jgi:CRP-like cAMP-binding protein